MVPLENSKFAFNGYLLFQPTLFKERADYTWQTRTFLKSVNEGEKRYNLYRVEKFYVEVEYDSNENIITGLKSFKSLAPLERFINDIDLTELQ